MILVAKDKRVYSFAGCSLDDPLPDGASLQRILAGEPCGLPRSLHRPVQLNRSVVVEAARIERLRGTWKFGTEAFVDGRWWPVARRRIAAVRRAMR